MAELRIIGIDDTITFEDIVQTVSKIGGCKMSEVRTGPIRIAGRGMGTVWVRCLLNAANKLAEMGKIKVGWFSARVEMLPGKRLHCFRCLRPGHAKGKCTAEEDFSNRCYNCSDIGHKLQDTTKVEITKNSMEMVENLRKLGCLMNIKLHFLDSYIDYFPENLNDYSEEQGEQFHQDIKEMERRHQGK
ncbi:putative 50 kda protein in type i retrotransposable element r1dm [Lasius niger]|uniref:Putative 50 kDa protein in type i retrotransposable element r1dm n=1 Tax=Lasius niger TaxID=67767 RepID=A0A0J7K8I3_LASNI|nr:putative 50 kda protein in type i retrotransposable element r1dm [Lasius niger]